MSTKKSGIEIISEERARQIEVEGWTPAHDDQHTRAELAQAANCYSALTVAMATCHMDFKPSEIYPPKLQELHWPWADEWWKPSDDPIRNLAKAGALIAAEIDRLQRKTSN